MSQEDIAQEHEAREWERRNINRQHMRTFAPGEAGYGPECCETCDDPMPPTRRAMGAVLCTACKALTERVRR